MKDRKSSASSPASPGAELMKGIEQLAREKGIDVDILVGAIEDAITAASRKHQERAGPAATGAQPRAADSRRAAPAQENLVSRLARETGEIHVFARKRVVEQVENPGSETTLAEAQKVDSHAQIGAYVDFPRSTKGLGRIEAQAAKQVILQKVRDAEREIVYNEWSARIGELVTGTVKRFERGDLVLEFGRSEAALPRRYQSRAEMFSPGDRVRAVLVEVSKNSKGPQVIVSRTDAQLLIKLLEMEVPEIYDGTVRLRHAVREPGERAKIAVESRAKDVDPVGACVGMKGSRVQAIIRELRGEKIDIVQFSDDITTFTASALNPAKVSRVHVASAAERTLDVVVEDPQLSLAIGKKGQNVRLASRLVGWKIDIKSEEETRREAEQTMAEMARRSTSLADVPGLGGTGASSILNAEGIRTAEELLRATPERLGALPGIGADEAARWRKTVEDYVQAPPTVLSPAGDPA